MGPVFSAGRVPQSLQAIDLSFVGRNIGHLIAHHTAANTLSIISLYQYDNSTPSDSSPQSKSGANGCFNEKENDQHVHVVHPAGGSSSRADHVISGDKQNGVRGDHKHEEDEQEE